KPGASPVAAYLSHSIIGLHQKGYGLLLGQANFSCSKIYCHWATMSTDDDNFIVVPFCMLPTERLHPPNPDKVREQKRKIRELIVTKPNIDIINNQDSLELIRQMNEDVEEANYLNLRLFEKFSFTTKEQDNKEKPLIITSTILEQKDYGSCLTNFKKRLGLKGNQDLRVLINVVMNPWPTEHNFITKLTNNFKETLKDMVSIMTIRNTISPDHGFLIPYPEKAYIFTKHAFIMQGFNEIYLTHLPMFHLETHRYQVIMKVMLPENIMR
ncbi:29805_t:CDS:2, partial [Gigaspora margarita]